MATVVETRELHKVYRSNGMSVEALRGITFEIEGGEFVAVMGPSGCGKSTLLHLLAGLDTPTRGEVWIAKHRVDTLSESARAVLRRRTIGFVFQAYNLIPNLTVADNVDLPGLLAGRKPADVARARNTLLETLGIADKANSFPNQLSGGQQQRVAIARAVINQPAVLLADEPTGNLDIHSGEEVLELLRNFHSQGQTVVLVTHNPKVASYAQRVFFMRDGKFVSETRIVSPGDIETIVRQLLRLETVSN